MDEAADNTAGERTSIGEGVTAALRQPSFLRVMLVLAATVVVLVGIRLGAPILNPIFLAVVLTLLCSPVYSWLLRRGLPAPLALLIMLVLLTVIFVGLIFILGGSISRFSERVGFYTTQLNGQVDSLDALLNRLGLSNVEVRDVVKPGALADDRLSVFHLLGVAAGGPGAFLALPITLFLAVMFGTFPETRWLTSLIGAGGAEDTGAAGGTAPGAPTTDTEADRAP
jgi:AI-2 transport protein TqsA